MILDFKTLKHNSKSPKEWMKTDIDLMLILMLIQDRRRMFFRQEKCEQ